MPDPDYEAKYGRGPHLTADAIVVRAHDVALILPRRMEYGLSQAAF